MAFITGYFDESYSHAPEPLVYTVAGYISTDEKWIEFQKEWQEVLKRENIKHFSMKDFANSHSKTYENWTDERKTAFLIELHTIIDNTYIRGFSSSVIVEDYNALSDEFKFALGKPHSLAMVRCLKLIEDWCHEINLREPINYVFEKGAEDNKSLNRVFNELLSFEIQMRYRVNSFSFCTKELAPLQSADILAYETRKDISRRYKKERPRSMRKSLGNLIDWKRNDWCVLDKHYFEWVTNQPLFKTIPNTEEHKSRVALAKKKGIIN